jgi:TonB-dependent starch-binding outer membrane protein SusC
VENRGLELSISTKNISGKNFTWTTSANITLPKNKLLSFPGIATSGYYKVYETGKSLNTFYGLHLLGVDPVTGVYQFEDVNKDGGISLEDYTAGHNLDPRYYGGISNTLSYKNWDLNLLMELKKQLGYNYNNYPVYNFTPGAMYNLPAVFLDRWQQTGDYKPVQQFTQTFTPAFDGQYYFTLSDGRLSDASYLRLKNISLSYRLTEHALKKIAAKELRLYLMAQNAWTVTSYKGGDPEIQNLFILPPLRTFVAGIQITF